MSIDHGSLQRNQVLFELRAELSKADSQVRHRRRDQHSGPSEGPRFYLCIAFFPTLRPVWFPSGGPPQAPPPRLPLLARLVGDRDRDRRSAPLRVRPYGSHPLAVQYPEEFLSLAGDSTGC